MAKAHTPSGMNERKPVSGQKPMKAQKSYLKLLRRSKKEGDSLWLKDALSRNKERLIKFGIDPESIQA